MSADTVLTLAAEQRAPAHAAGRHRGRRKPRASLGAHGETMVWLTGGALAVALAMIVGLLAFMAYEGTVTFWPVEVTRFQLADGKAYLGEVTRDETYLPETHVFENLPLELAAKARAEVQAAGGAARRRLVRTGNFELSMSHFHWIDDFLLSAEDRPPWALVLERAAWGRFYGIPLALTRDGQDLAETPESVWSQFQVQHPPVRERMAERRDLERAVGRINDRLENARLALIAVGLRRGQGSPAWTAQQQRVADYQAEADREIADIRDKIAALDKENDRYQLVLSTVDGQQATIRLSEIVRAYPANRLGLGGKLGVYLSRWWEFLTDDPREANSEGGVWPAIFGTVVMTLIMTLAVVPFGVLAALYIREYSKGGLAVTAVRIAINNLAGVPSIVFGVFGLGFFCYQVGGYIDTGPDHPWPAGRWFIWLGVLLLAALTAAACTWLGGRSRVRGHWLLSQTTVVLWLACAALVLLVLAKTPYFDGFFLARSSQGSPTFGKGGLLWASLTLALLTLPVVIVATEEALSAVPRSMREGSYACGASKWQTIRRIVLPRAMPGIMTGMILAMARGAGEVAPLMLVGAAKSADKLSIDTVPPFLHPERSFMHLGFHIFDLGFQSPNSEAAKPMVFTTTLLLITLIAVLNLSAVWLRSRLSQRFRGAQF